MTDETRWHMDKKVPITIIVALVGQTAAFVWWAAGQAYRVEDHERRLAFQERSAEVRSQRDLIQEGRLARIEEGIRALLDSVQRVERRIDGRQ